MLGVLPADFNMERHKELRTEQPGDVRRITYADTSALETDSGFKTEYNTSREGLRRFGNMV